MDEQTYIMILTILRFFLILVTNHVIMVILSTYILGTKRRLWVLCGYLFGKMLIIDTLFGFILREYYAELYMRTPWMQTFYNIGLCVTAILSFFIFYYTFKGSIYKIMLASFFSDLFAACVGNIGVLTVDILASRDVSFPLDVSVPFRLPDLLIPVISITGCLFLIHLLRPWLAKIRQYEIRHTKFMAILFCCFIASVTYPLFSSFSANTKWLGGTICVWEGIFLFFYLTWSWKWKDSLQKERDFLKLQLRLMESHYNSIHRQSCYIAHSQEMIDHQMQDICKAKPALQNERILGYLDSLQEEYQAIGSATYCDDWVLNAALSTQSEIMKQENITFDCALPGYNSGRIKQMDITYLVLFLLSFGIAETSLSKKKTDESSLFFHINVVTNQLIIEMSFDTAAKRKLTEHALRKYIKDYNYTMNITQKAKRTTLVLALER